MVASIEISPSSAGSVGAQQLDAIPRQRAAHRSGLDGLPGRIACERRGFGLAEAVANRHSPRGAHALDHLRVERLAGGDRLAQPHPVRRQILLDEHAPHRRGRAKRRNRLPRQHAQGVFHLETRVVVGEHRGLRVPGREHAAPGMFRPARRADIPMHVARLEPEPVHGGKMPDRVTLVRMHHQLRFRGRAGGKIEQQRIGSARDSIRREGAWLLARLVQRRHPGSSEPATIRV